MKLCVRNTGLTETQFYDLLDSLQSVYAVIQKRKTCVTALYMYLMKMRTGFPCEDIANIFNVSRTTVQRLISKMRQVLKKDFVPIHVNFVRDRDELLLHNTNMSNCLLDPEKQGKIVLVCDGTYIYVEKSQNYLHQKKTFSGQKMRNFIKVMNVTACDGTIVYCIAPFPAVQNDAKILESLIENTSMFDNLLPGDVLLLDRGFRDVVKKIEEKGILVKMPALVQSSERKGQLTTENANKSRLVTALRFVVEVRNGHLKSIFKMFDTVWCAYAQLYLSDDAEICSALINKYFPVFESNKGISSEVANRMLSKLNEENVVGTIISNNFKNHMKKFTLFENFNELPRMAKDRLFWISLGKYQIKQAKSYTQMHVKRNNNYFNVWICPDNICREAFSSFYVDDRDPALYMMKLDSRFRSQTTHKTFLLINRTIYNVDTMACDETAVLGYYCECYSGWRTVGCCSHIMTLIMFLFVTKGQDLADPSGFLNDMFQ